jgi:hypothetical protein
VGSKAANLVVILFLVAQACDGVLAALAVFYLIVAILPWIAILFISS